MPPSPIGYPHEACFRPTFSVRGSTARAAPYPDDFMTHVSMRQLFPAPLSAVTGARA
jgi:hypothetical protein